MRIWFSPSVGDKIATQQQLKGFQNAFHYQDRSEEDCATDCI
jgi:hypothetical protein